MESFTDKLLEWYNPELRKHPWKNTKDAYKIWLSEIIMQQTRVEQGTPYYLAFVKKYPRVLHLANAPIDEVLKLWEGLGYYSRARNLHYAAQQIVTNFGGKFPSDYNSLLHIKGIGKYTAAAIASFAYDKPYAVVDGNVFRVLSRVFGIDIPIDTTTGKKRFEELAQDLLDIKNPATYNQAIMDFGALICKPKNPECTKCPFQSECIALAKNKIAALPVKSKKIIKQEREFYYLVYKHPKYTYLTRRENEDIWKGLFEFPCIEISNEKERKLFLRKKTVFESKQVLSHQIIHARFFEIEDKAEFNSFIPKQEMLIKVELPEIQNFAFPKIMRKYLQPDK